MSAMPTTLLRQLERLAYGKAEMPQIVFEMPTDVWVELALYVPEGLVMFWEAFSFGNMPTYDFVADEGIQYQANFDDRGWGPIFYLTEDYFRDSWIPWGPWRIDRVLRVRLMKKGLAATTVWFQGTLYLFYAPREFADAIERILKAERLLRLTVGRKRVPEITVEEIRRVVG